MPLTREFKETVPRRASDRTASIGRSFYVKGSNAFSAEISTPVRRYFATTSTRRLGSRSSVAEQNGRPRA